MAVITWDEVGTRTYESGVDHGVLYPPEGHAVPWNGLMGISESRSEEVKSYFIDGIKYLDYQTLGAYTGKLQAITYPEELDALTGIPEFAAGVFLHDQTVKRFGLTYRTKIGHDLDPDAGYKLHLLYNVLATPGDNVSISLGKETVPQVFEWTINTTPPGVTGIRPTAHISIDSRSIDPDLLSTIEMGLYGLGVDDPILMPLEELLAFIEAFYGP